MFFDNYCKLCKEIKMSPTAVALKLGMSRAAVSNWKNEGRIPQIPQLQKIASFFNNSIDDLLGNEKKPTTQESSELAEIEKLIQDAKNRKANETIILKYSGGKPEAVILSDEEMKIIDVLIENAQNRHK